MDIQIADYKGRRYIKKGKVITSYEIEETKIAPWNDSEVRWVCENHPTKDQSHRLFPCFWKECGGAGMPEPTEENRRKGYLT